MALIHGGGGGEAYPQYFGRGLDTIDFSKLASMDQLRPSVVFPCTAMPRILVTLVSHVSSYTANNNTAAHEIVEEARPLSGFVPTHADSFYTNAFLIIKLSKLLSFRVIRALIASQSTFEKIKC